MEVPKTVVFNGVEYRLMGSGRYYLSQSRSNEGRRHAKGLHVAIWEFYSGQTVPKGYEVHHKDGNPFNNDFSNLECLPRSEHRAMWEAKDPEKQRKHLERIRPLSAAWHSSPEGLEWHRKHVEESIGKRTTKQYVCEFCGKEFESTCTTPVRFCSHNCAVKWDYRNKCTEETRTCVVCGSRFTALVGPGRKKTVETCSRSCAGKLRAKRKGNRTDYGESVRCTCQECGNEFETKRTYAFPDGRPYCSKTCSARGGAKKRRGSGL